MGSWIRAPNKRTANLGGDRWLRYDAMEGLDDGTITEANRSAGAYDSKFNAGLSMETFHSGSSEEKLKGPLILHENQQSPVCKGGTVSLVINVDDSSQHLLNESEDAGLEYP